MVKVSHTAYPPSRNGGANPSLNVVREGGLYYADKQNELLEQSRVLINKSREIAKEPAPKRKDEFKEKALAIFLIALAAWVLLIALLVSLNGGLS